MSGSNEILLSQRGSFGYCINLFRSGSWVACKDFGNDGKRINLRKKKQLTLRWRELFLYNAFL